MGEWKTTDKNVELSIMEWTKQNPQSLLLSTNQKDIFPQHKYIMCSSG
jgi:hypothetical protein